MEELQQGIRMRGPGSLKREFLKKWRMGLQAYNSSKDMCIMQRKNAIKLSADVAMASARNGSTCWSRAIMANASRNDNSKAVTRSKKVLRRRRCHAIRRSVKKVKSSQTSCIAKRLVKKRTVLLRSLVPGGESMDECSLIEETLDYITCLQAQVDVMRRLANASMLLFSK